MNKKDVSAMLITGDGLRHTYVAECLNMDLNLIGIVRETKKPVPTGESVCSSKMLKEHFLGRDTAEKKYFKITGEYKNIETLNIPNGDVNEGYVFEWIMKSNPEYLILYGSGIVRERLLDTFKNKCINMHLGLSPYYRGSGTNMWPLVNNEPECVGVTIHLAELAVDAGLILRQVRPSAELNDTIHDLGCKTIKTGAQILGPTISDFHYEKIEGVPQDLLIGRVYKRNDFNSKALEIIYKNYEEGMMDSYISDMSSRLNKFPIID